MSSPVAVRAQHWGWQADPELVRRLMAQDSAINYDEALVQPYTLSDLLPSGETREGWLERRTEVLNLFRENVYGRSPGPPEKLRFEIVEENPQAMEGRATLKRVSIVSTQSGREHRFELILYLPNSRPEPVPVFLLINNRGLANTDPTRNQKSEFWPAEAIIARGYGIAALQNGDLAPDDPSRFRSGAIGLFEGDTASPRPENAWGALAAWAWGASRAMDYFETDARIDARKVAVVGHSRGGKAALWAGAEDERFALVISNNSGEGGAALRSRNFGETVNRITDAFPHWFAGAYPLISSLPEQIDQHMLIALMAPRAVYVASADEDLWSDPRGEFLSLAGASPVYALWGEPAISGADMPPPDRPLWVGRRGYHIRSGPHNLTLYDWERFADFAGMLWP